MSVGLLFLPILISTLHSLAVTDGVKVCPSFHPLNPDAFPPSVTYCWSITQLGGIVEVDVELEVLELVELVDVD